MLEVVKIIRITSVYMLDQSNSQLFRDWLNGSHLSDEFVGWLRLSACCVGPDSHMG